MTTDYGKFTLVNYFDVWGNAEDGWDVNNWCVEYDDLCITDDATDKEILEYLVKTGFLTTSDMRRLAVENLGEFIEIYERRGMKPLCSLRQNIIV